MENCSNFQNYFDYLSECLEKFQTSKTSKKMTSTELTETFVRTNELETTQVMTSTQSWNEIGISTVTGTPKISTTSMEFSVTQSDLAETQVLTTTESSTESVMLTDSSELDFDGLVTWDNIEGSSEVGVTVKSASQKANFKYWPTVLITAGSWLIIAIFVFTCLKYKKRYRVRQPSSDTSIDYIPFRRRISKKSRSERDQIVNDSVITPADNPISIV